MKVGDVDAPLTPFMDSEWTEVLMAAASFTMLLYSTTVGMPLLVPR